MDQSFLTLLLQIFGYCLPAVIVLFTVQFMVKTRLEKDIEIKKMELNSQAKNSNIHLQLQAYERIILFLARTSFDSMIERLGSAANSAGDQHFVLVNALRSEFEHNLTQQLYVTDDAWNALKKAYHFNLELLHKAYATVKPTESAKAYNDAVLNIIIEGGADVNAITIDIIKNEAKNLLY